jgi:tetratricopeptide (TPR) repeat protein
LLIACYSPLSWADPIVDAQVDSIERLLVEWQVQAAFHAFQPLLSDAPKDPRVIALHARLLFYQGEYDKAVSQLERIKPQLGPEMRSLASIIYATKQTVENHSETKSAGGHFRIRAKAGKDALLVPYAFQTLEATRERLAADLGYAPSDTILVEIYEKPEDLATVSSLTEAEIHSSGTIALCKYNRLMIVSPRALLRGYAWRDTLAHEYVHLVVSRISRNTVPIWLHEGLAKYFEARWRLPHPAATPLSPTQEHVLAEALRTAKLIPWARMHPSMAKLPNQRATTLAFAQVQTAVEFVAKTWGLRSIGLIISRLREGSSSWRAIEEVTKLDEAQFNQSWKKHLATLKLQRLPGLIPDEKHFGKAPSKEKQLAALKEKRARDYFRLADMLRQRGLRHAAIIEYRKVRELIGSRDAFVANALGRTYLEVGDPTQAINTLLPVLEYYPNVPAAQVALGIAYVRSGDKDNAVKHLDTALRLNPFDPEMHCALADALPQQSTLVPLHKEHCRQLSGR